jgi:hypothetical protein
MSSLNAKLDQRGIKDKLLTSVSGWDASVAKIFISYRRDDSEYQTDRLHRELKRYVENPKEDIFIDVDNIPYGVDFVEHLQRKVSQCEILLAVIGKRWLNHISSNTGKRSLEDPDDFVRIEIATALERGIPVVPVLLDGAPVPSVEDIPEDLQPLARRNGKFVNRMSFSADVRSLVEGLPIEIKQTGSVDGDVSSLPPEDDATMAWMSIEQSLAEEDYQDFKEHFPSSRWAFEATKRIRQLETFRARRQEWKINSKLGDLNATHVLQYPEQYSEKKVIMAREELRSYCHLLNRMRDEGAKSSKLFEALDEELSLQFARFSLLEVSIEKRRLEEARSKESNDSVGTSKLWSSIEIRLDLNDC